MSLITWNFDKNFIYVIIYWVLEIIYRIISSLKSDFFKLTKEIVHNKYIFVMLNILVDLLAGFLVLYIECESKSKKIIKIDQRTESELIYTKLDKLKKKIFI